MSEQSDQKTNQLNNHTILVVDFSNDTREMKPASDFPQSIQFKNRRRIVDGKDVVTKVPVREIRIRPIGMDGGFVAKEKATLVNIEYLDEKGDVLESTTMQKK
ncbi:MAG: hypothetical protein QM709_01530 [Spongiibacteraceae bacterium]